MHTTKYKEDVLLERFDEVACREDNERLRANHVGFSIFYA